MQREETPAKTANPAKTECIACKNELAPGATVCAKCASFQKPWKNHLLYGAKVVGVLALFASAVVFILSHVEDIRKIFFWNNKLEIFALNSSTHITLVNLGDGEVFLSHIEFHTTHEGWNRTQTLTIGKLLKVGESLNHPFVRTSGKLNAVRRRDKDTWDAIVRRAFSRDDCFLIIVLYERDPIVKQFQEAYGEGLRLLRTTAKLHFYSLGQRENKIQDVSVVGMLMVRTEPNCANATDQKRPLADAGPTS